MRALALEAFDAPPAVIEVADPEPAAGEVLVRVGAASINYYDAFVASGAMRAYVPYEFPAVLGQDVSGVALAVGDGVDGFAPGDRVFGTLGAKGVIRDGTFAELATPLAGDIVRAPDGLPDPDAASLGVAGTTAVNAVAAVAPAEGSTVLVVGATGGVGSFAVQLASLRGAAVIASVRPGDEAFVRGLGAAATVDYTGDVAAAVREGWPGGIDALVDLVSRDPAVFASLTGLVRPGGRAVSVVGGAGEETRIGEVDVSNVSADPGHLPSLAELVVAGSVRVPVQRTYSLSDAARALEDFTTGHTLGKVVVEAG